MKKCIILLLTVVLSFYCPITASAETSTDTVIVETFEDGSYLETVIKDADIPTTYSTTKTGQKIKTYKDSEGNSIWSVTVTGTFTYTGSTATCTKSTVSATSYKSSWKISTSSASKSGATATATATAKKYADGEYIKSMTQSVSLTCSKNGTLS